MKYKNKKINNYRYKQLMRAKERRRIAQVAFYPYLSPLTYKQYTEQGKYVGIL